MYLDPGSGSILIQLLLGAILAVGIIVRLSWKKIRTLFGKKNPDATGDAAPDDDEAK